MFCHVNWSVQYAGCQWRSLRPSNLRMLRVSLPCTTESSELDQPQQQTVPASTACLPTPCTGATLHSRSLPATSGGVGQARRCFHPSGPRYSSCIAGAGSARSARLGFLAIFPRCHPPCAGVALGLAPPVRGASTRCPPVWTR